jgi:hypothetical protein
MTVEKTTLISENDKLQSQLTGNLNDPESMHMSLRVQEENKREIEQLRERNYELEAIVDDFKVKNQVSLIVLFTARFPSKWSQGECLFLETSVLKTKT